ncbi:MAG: hypothetical protein ACPHO8_17545, partial [Mariniblastus sp.]
MQNKTLTKNCHFTESKPLPRATQAMAVFSVVGFLILVLAGHAHGFDDPQNAKTDAPISYNRDIRPILSE